MNKQKIIREYERLARLPVLCTADSERMAKILELSELDETLTEELTKIDLKVNQELGLLSEEYLHYYQDQAAKLREYVGLNLKDLPCCKEKTADNRKAEIATVKITQKRHC